MSTFLWLFPSAWELCGAGEGELCASTYTLSTDLAAPASLEERWMYVAVDRTIQAKPSAAWGQGVFFIRCWDH